MKAFLYTFLVISAIDLVTKLWDTERDWTWHVKEGFHAFTFMDILFLVAFTTVGVQLSSAGAGALVAGILGNLSWAALAGGVPNMILDRSGEYAFAFNIADIAIMAGLCAFGTDLMIYGLGRRRDGTPVQTQ